MKLKKFVLVLLTVTLCSTIFTGCPKSSGIDETKTQLYVYNYDGGIGTEWLYDVKARFEAKYAEEVFEPGTSKKGVEIIINAGNDNMSNTIKTSTDYNVYFTESIAYNDLISQDSFLDLTDMINESLSDVSDGKDTRSIADKMTSEQKTAFTAINGNHYVIPHYEAYSGVVYDKKVFNDKRLYLKDGYSGFQNSSSWVNKTAKRTPGPDGVYDTDDDGLPSSIEEFCALIEQIAHVGAIPFTYAGAFPEYLNKLPLGMWASLAGADEFMLNVNYGKDSVVSSGKTSIVTGFNGEEPIVEEKDITPATAYLLSQQASKYHALKPLEKMLSSSNYYSDKISGATYHTDAQRMFVYSDLETNPIAMLIEGSYWYNEAKDYLKSSENTYKDKAKNRQFAWMPLPVQVEGTVTEGNGEKNTLVESLAAFGLVSSNIKNNTNLVKLAKKFLKFCYTDESLVAFTESTGVARGLQYEIPAENLSNMSFYAKNLWELRQNSKIVYPYSDNKLFVNTQERISSPSKWKTGSYGYPSNAFKDKKSLREVFQGMSISKSTWDENSKYFE